MPSRPDPVLDERYDEIVAQLRATRPRSSAGLRQRVREIARAEPAPRRSLADRLPSRKLVFALAAAAALAAIVAYGATRGEKQGDEIAFNDPAAVSGRAVQEDAALESTAAPPTSAGRLQDYRAELTVRVQDVEALSRATARAMRIAQTLGGFVVSASYDARAEGDSLLVVRVPIGRVQEAISQYATLGTIVGQRFALQDLQAGVDELDARIDQVRDRVASLRRDLRDPNLTDDERAVLRQRIEQARDELAALLDQRGSTVRQAQTAEISLTLTTREPATPAPPPGELEETLRDAVGALATVSVWLLAALIVVSPFLVLALVGTVGVRRFRRRAAERLLERPGS
jgi:hypothetical protein